MKTILRLLQSLLNMVQPCAPLSFRERREIVLRTWERYGYNNRPVPGKQTFELHTKINNLMYTI